MEAYGGGDPPEAVLDGMDAAADLNWSKDNETKKYIFHIFDAPPHGKEFKGTGDRYPNGCPCGKNYR